MMKDNALLRLTVLLVVFGTLAFFVPIAHAASNLPLKLKKSEVFSTTLDGRKIICGLVNKSWTTVQKVKGGYSLKKNSPKADKAFCARRLGRGTLKSLSQLPNISALTKANASAASIQAVSGEAPALPDIPSMDVTTLFWRPGIVDAIVNGTPTQQQCGEFFSGRDDGESGGLNSCYMTMEVGHSFEPVLRSGTTLCFMRELPTKANLSSGALSIISGDINDITQLFMPPTGSTARIVEVQARGGGGRPVGGGGGGGEGGQNLFLKIFPKSDNDKKGNQYNVETWFCRLSASTPRNLEKIIVKLNGQYLASSVGIEDQGQHDATITAYLIKSGSNLIFDPSMPREAALRFGDSSFYFKSDLQITSDNLIKSKTYNAMSGAMGSFNRKAYSVAHFSGENMSTLRFLEGAVKDLSSQGEKERGFSGATEFRDTYYASAPQSNLLSDLADVDLSSDSFYSAPGSISVDLSNYSCSVTPDIVVSANMGSPALSPVVLKCQGEQLDRMNFCDSETLKAARQAAFAKCSFGPPPHG